MSRIIKVKVRVISRRLRLITLTETLTFLEFTKTEFYNKIVLLYIEQKMEVMFLLLH